MALPFLFANVSTLATPALDANYAALGALTPIPCTVAGTNTLTMTPLPSTPTVASYSNYMQLTGIAISTNTSSVSAVVGALATLPVYKDTSSGPVVLTGSEIGATCAFGLMYDSALNSGNGGFHLLTSAAGSSVIPVTPDAIEFVVDGSGSVLTVGNKGYLQIPFDCTITQATLLADQSGSAVVNVLKCTYAQFDAGSTHPVIADSITAAAPPTISSATKSQDGTLTGWTTAISSGDILGFSVASIASIERVTLSLKVTV